MTGGDTWPLQDVYNGIICPWDNSRLVWEYRCSTVQYRAVQCSTVLVCGHRTGEGEDSFQVDSSITVECV